MLHIYNCIITRATQGRGITLAICKKTLETNEHFFKEWADSGFEFSSSVTNNEAKSRQENFTKVLLPTYEKYTKKVSSKLGDSKVYQDLGETYRLITRKIESMAEIYREENNPLKKQCAEIELKMTEKFGKLTGVFDGREVTISQLWGLTKDRSREKRKSAFEAINSSNLTIADEIDEGFSELVSIRDKMGRNAGFENYIGYRFKEFYRLDWGPAQCFEFHQGVRKHIALYLKDSYRVEKTVWA